ncbi:EAL domain-containing protein [Tepidamorphus sp. 3E244]|uniref:bifunctional diguanylate cyclase/phosphodiesterase n=1 Tax=Tepidamorphus sp. 3E244 TaxID=3385498 RepID=UPI0038FC0C2B
MNEHDHLLVAIAALICGVGVLVATSLYRRARSTRGYARLSWVGLGAIAAGSTIWCTHFVAMLAYQPGVPISYDTVLTLVSLLIAVAGSTLAMLIGSLRIKLAPAVGGGIFGLAIAAMHYTGMAAFSVGGFLTWSQAYVSASVAIAIPLGAAAFHMNAAGMDDKRRWAGAVLMILSIVGMHFTGMSAVTIHSYGFDGIAGLDDTTRMMLVFGVTGVGCLVLSTAAISFFLDNQARSHLVARMRYLTESAVDGMVVCRNGKILHANAAFEKMSGRTRENLLHGLIFDMIENPSQVKESELVRTTLRSADGPPVQVEVTKRTESVRDNLDPLAVFAFRDISQRIANEQRISYLAAYDSLTGLRNRTSFYDEAKTMMSAEGQRKLAILELDMDRFKEINDGHGHAAGDHVLQAIGTRLRDSLTPGQIAARIGGDEFVILAPISDRNEAREIAESVLETMSHGIEHEGRVFRCGASIGIAMFPFDGESVEELMNNADLAMYRAKQKSDGNYCFYNGEMDNLARERRSLIEDLRNAIDNEELELHYQVQISVPNETVSGYEALLRWTHPVLGSIPPNRFIPLAEQSGLIIPLGEWVLREACREAASWNSTCNISVNLSAEQLSDPELANMVLSTLLETGLSPSRLELEVTETSFINDQARAAATLGQLKAMGVSISIDDFGTGYSSLAMLREFPFDKIKLDKSLIDEVSRNQKAQGIFRAVLSLGNALSVPVLAEGVETSEQLEFLREHGCELVQGYYYGRPQPQADWRIPAYVSAGVVEEDQIPGVARRTGT